MSQRLDYNQIAPAGVKALGGVYGYIMQCGLPAVLVDLVHRFHGTDHLWRIHVVHDGLYLGL